MFCFSLLVNSQTLSNFLSIFIKCYLVFGSVNISSKVQESFESLQSSFEGLGINSNIDSDDFLSLDCTEIEMNVISEMTSEEEDIIRQCKQPFVAFFEKHLEEIAFELNDKHDGQCNPLYQPKWLNLMKHKWLATVPFWTSILRGIINKELNTNYYLPYDVYMYS